MTAVWSCPKISPTEAPQLDEYDDPNETNFRRQVIGEAAG